jgi:hypothetical protein
VNPQLLNPPPLDAPAIQIVTVPSNHFLSASQVQAIRDAEIKAQYGNGHINGHAKTNGHGHAANGKGHDVKDDDDDGGALN